MIPFSRFYLLLRPICLSHFEALQRKAFAAQFRRCFKTLALLRTLSPDQVATSRSDEVTACFGLAPGIFRWCHGVT